MKSEIVLLLGVFAVAVVQVQSEKLIWADEFDTLDLGKWTHLITGWDGGNGEFQYYRNNRKNSYTKNGVLYIQPTPAADEIPNIEKGRILEHGCNMSPCLITGGYDIVSPYFSARMLTRDSFSVKYGRIEIRAKMATGDWLWPAVWMYPTNETYGTWPRSGEIDIIEVHGNPELKGPDGVNHGITEVGSAVHFGPFWDYKATINNQKQSPPGKTWGDDFHKYEFIWNRDQMKFLVDGQLIHQIDIPEAGITQNGGILTDIYKKQGGDKNAPFDKPFHFILNVAVGGQYFPEDWKSTGGRLRPWKGGDNRRQFWKARDTWQPTWGTSDRHSLQIDYIRVYQ